MTRYSVQVVEMAGDAHRWIHLSATDPRNAAFHGIRAAVFGGALEPRATVYPAGTSTTLGKALYRADWNGEYGTKCGIVEVAQ